MSSKESGRFSKNLKRLTQHHKGTKRKTGSNLRRNNHELSQTKQSKTSNTIRDVQLELNTKSNTIKDVLIDLGIPWKSTLTNIPSKKDREQNGNLHEKDQRRWTHLVRTTQLCIESMSRKIMWPGPCNENLIEEVSKKLSRAKDQKFVLFDRWKRAMSDVYRVSPKGSIERRVFVALLVKVFGGKTSTMKRFMEENNLTMNSRARDRAYGDFASLVNGESLSKTEYKRQVFDDNTVNSLVEFILLNPDNVGTLSWGTNTFHLSTEEIHTLPKITRKKDRVMLWNEYQQSCLETNAKCVSRSTFLKILNTITHQDEVTLRAIDYVSVLLVNEPIEVLQDIVNVCMDSQTERERLTCIIELTKNFIKYQFPKHVLIDDDNCCTHGLHYSLGRAFPSTDSDRRTMTCKPCSLPFFACDSLIDALSRNENNDNNTPDTTTVSEETMNDAIQVARDTKEKFKLFMAHKARCACQNSAISKLHQHLQDECIKAREISRTAVMIMDFKMKWEPVSGRESTQGHFGKRGIGWHGCCIVYYKHEKVQKEDGTYELKATRYTSYIDQILSGTNKQDSMCVFSCLEAALLVIIEDLPFINNLVLQSDNANAYQSCMILLSIVLLNVKYKDEIFISKFIHSETQDGKTQLDAHFAKAAGFLKRFMKTWYRNKVTKINTPRGLAHALSWNGGMQNVAVQLLELDASHCDKIRKTLLPLSKKLSEYFSRVNEIVFGVPNFDNDEFNILDVASMTNLTCTLKVQAYSTIGRQVEFDLNFKTSTVQIDEAGQSDIQNAIKSLRNNVVVSNTVGLAMENENLTLITANNEGTMTSDNNAEEPEDFIVQDEEDIQNDTTLGETFFDDSDSEDDIGMEHSTKVADIRQYESPSSNRYDVHNLITRIVVHKRIRMGSVKKSLLQSKQMSQVPKSLSCVKSKDATAMAIRHAVSIVGREDNTFVAANTDNNAIYDMVVLQNDCANNETFGKGWAQRSRVNGTLYGKKNINMYREDIKEMFMRGKRDSEKKMNPAIMLENLKHKYTNLFSLPSETEIRTEISALLYKGKTSDINKDDDNDEPVRRRKQKESWLPYLSDIVEHNLSLSNKEILELFKEYILTNPDLFQIEPDMEVAKKKLPPIKAKYRKKAKQAAVG